jgi:acyl-coenzyme A synthetase/AMP-(fatty) acid ligase
VYESAARTGWVLRTKECLERGDCIALMMDARPMYPSIWLGALSTGIVTALINTHQRSKVLLHSLRIAKPKILIYGVEHSQGESTLLGKVTPLCYKLSQSQ